MTDLFQELWLELKRQVSTSWRAIKLWFGLTTRGRNELAELYRHVEQALQHGGRTGGPEILEMVLRLHALRKHSASHDEFMENVRAVLQWTGVPTYQH